MNEIDILKELEKLDDDIEPGFLSELKQQTPDELHSRIMNSIRMEAMNNNSVEELGIGIETTDNQNENNVIAFKPRFRFNYKKYATVASAAVILAVVFIGGAKELLNQSVTSESISPTTNISDNTNNNAFTKDFTNSNETAKNKETSETATETAAAAAKAADQAIADAKVDKSGVKTGDANKQNTNVADNGAGKKSNPAVDTTSKGLTASDKALASVSTTTPNTGNTEKVAKGTAKVEDDITIVTSKKPQTVKGIAAPTTVASADDKNTDKIAASDANTKGAANSTESNLKDYGDTEEVTNPSPNTIANDMKLASLENIVNYELNLNTSQNDIIQFIEDKGTPLYEGIYKLKYTDYIELTKLLMKNNILPKTVNELETNDQLVTIKIIKN